jgi:hypothetical protein
MLRAFRPRGTHLRQGSGGQAAVIIPATFLEGRPEVAFDVPGERMLQWKAAARDDGCHLCFARVLITVLF